MMCNLVEDVYHLKYLPIPFDENIKNTFILAFPNVQNIVLPKVTIVCSSSGS